MVCDQMPKSINISLQAPPVPDEVLRRLADLGHVPAAQREFFFESVRTYVQTACELHELVKEGLANKKFATLLRAALTLYEVLGNLNKDEREFMEQILGSRLRRIFDGISSGSVGGLRETAYQLAELFSLVTGKPPPRYPHQAPQPRQRGRRSGLVKNWIFQDFVFDLFNAAGEAEGKLTYNKNRPGPPLVKAIRMLEPHLPVGFVPKALSPSTLQRIQTHYNRTKASVDRIENLAPGGA
jgi:hypothetical protein